MDYLTTSTLLREQGIAFIAIGTFLVSLAWYLLRQVDKAHAFLVALWLPKSRLFSELLVFCVVVLCLIPGMRLIGEGGAKTTQGWNMLGKHDARIGLLTALAREWVANDLLRKRPPFVIPENDPSFGTLHIMYPQFTTTVSRQVLTSALFREEGNDQPVTTVLLYEHTVQNLNEQTTWINWSLTRMNVQAPERLAKYRSLHTSPPLEDFDKVHFMLHQYLVTRYPEILSAAQQDFQLLSKLTPDYSKTKSQPSPKDRSEPDINNH